MTIDTGVPMHRRAAIAATAAAVLSTGVLAAAPAHAAPSAPSAPSVSAQGAYAMNAATGKALFGKAADTELRTGSTTKIMTALVVLSQRNVDLNRKVKIKKEYTDYVIDPVTHTQRYSSANLILGDSMNVRDLLYGLLLPSGCDAAYALADTYGSGSTTAKRTKSFIAKMNAKARELGLTHTHFDSFDGVSNGKNHASPRDLAKLAGVALKNKTFKTVVGTKVKDDMKSYRPGGGTHAMSPWKNTNTLLNTYRGAIGVKTGSGPEAKFCLVFAATRNGKTVVGTVLADTSVDERLKDAKKILDYGFTQSG
ncbi:D-alanyl-D-alanine carboxypeptidase family protein [Streptomyces diastatochromogenes]|uniref:D-alanyl-D-alanine carboxypeptidase n=1 Tax=Streptomyces diastatochromogenes TaxID=42236 RepID=A0A233SME5_STRDA|nr:serine hydrolase [Streptomyces diastatochromogenes]MCZ0986386.1 D-alanyl-D-alanine carboxypeptidase [Streptomyces diastatochromogenes]OXY96759.1 D-alanyl-D-alanine carboxypeptidase [Streptomyces diastatochromogenes]